MSFDTNIVNLNEWRYRAIVAAQPPRRRVSPVVRAAGGILIVASLGFGAYVVYAAVRFGALTDPVVLGSLEVLSAYLLTGAVLFTGAYRLPFFRKSAAAATTVTPARRSSTTEQPGTLIKFPEPAREAESGPLMWVRCRFCSSPFQASGPRHECPSCGRMAAA
jgi:hypothetical protein